MSTQNSLRRLDENTPAQPSDPQEAVFKWLQSLWDKLHGLELMIDDKAGERTVRAMIIQRQPGSDAEPAQCEATFGSLPRVGDQLDLLVNGQRRFVTVITVRHAPTPGLPVIYASEGVETQADTLAVVQMGVANLVGRMDEIECRLQELLIATPTPRLKIIARLTPESEPVRREMILRRIPHVGERIVFKIDGEPTPLRVESVDHPEDGGVPTVILTPDYASD